MKVWTKLCMVVLPPVGAAVLLTALFAYSTSVGALEKAALEMLNKKATWVQRYMNDQAALLINEGCFDDEYMRNAALAGIERYADTLLQDTWGVRNNAEIIAAFDDAGELVFFAGDEARKRDTALLPKHGRKYLVVRALSEAFSLEVYAARERRNVLEALDGVITASFLILFLALFMAAVFLRFLAAAVAGPAGAMKAVKDIEEKRRNVLPLYTPGEAVRKMPKPPAGLPADAKYEGTILYSKIRWATSPGETPSPAEYAAFLDRSVAEMTAIVRKKTGVMFNAENNALLAGWGIPEPHTKDAAVAVHTALLMVDALATLNEENGKMGLPPSNMRIGLDIGGVTVENATSGKGVALAMDGPVYAAIRLQKLARSYKETILFTENVYRKVYAYFPCRFVDKVTIPGSRAVISLFTARLKIEGREKELWKHHRVAVKLFYARKFTEALFRFEQALLKNPDDGICSIFIDRCRQYIKSPPSSVRASSSHESLP